MDLFAVFLYLHILGAVVAFGPGFAAMVVGPMVAKEPQHTNFYARTQLATNRRLVIPVALSLPVTGLAMILNRGWDNLTGGGAWLPTGILLYIVAITFSLAVLLPAGARLVELTSVPPAPGTPPSPEIPATVRRLRLGGAFLGLLVVVIALIMVTRAF